MWPATAHRFESLAKKVGSGSEIHRQAFGRQVPACQCGTKCGVVNGPLLAPGNMNQKYMNSR